MAYHTSIGLQGESAARTYLRKKGYTIIERNHRTKRGEVDVVAKKSGTLVFVEVRTKHHEQFGTPEDTLNRKKRRKLIMNARSYVAWHGYEGRYRIDALCVVLSGDRLQRITHYENIAENPLC